MKCPYPGCGGNMAQVSDDYSGLKHHICKECGAETQIWKNALVAAFKKCHEQGKRLCAECETWHSSDEWCPNAPCRIHGLHTQYITCERCGIVSYQFDVHNCKFSSQRRKPPKAIDDSVQHPEFTVQDTLKSSLVVAFNDDGSVTVTPNFD